MVQLLNTHPGQIRNLIERQFIVAKDGKSKGIQTQSGRYSFRDLWTVGSVGIVAYVLFDSRDLWSVNVEYQGPVERQFLAIDKFDLDDIPVHEFFAQTKPDRLLVAILYLLALLIRYILSRNRPSDNPGAIHFVDSRIGSFDDVI